MKDVFIIGSKGIPAKYGGFETFVEKLTEGKQKKEIRYHISCLAKDNNEFEHNGARCFNINVPNIGAAKAVLYDILALRKSIEYIQKNKINQPIIYILACRIGPFVGYYKRKLEKLGGNLFVNPDGHEWKRGKWNFIIRKYWKVSERYMVKHADLLVCDSKNIEKYIKQDYSKYNPKTTFIAYGADIDNYNLDNDTDELLKWYKEKSIEANNYYLVVGRFVQENNYETMISEFIKSNTKKSLVLITNVDNNKFYESLKEKTRFAEDDRIKFVGTVYNQQLLAQIRRNAYGYIHGHEVGGTNPSLLEALATTKLNLLLDVGFNREVGEDGALYFTKEAGNLSDLIDNTDILDKDTIAHYSKCARERIDKEYKWSKITESYEELFIK